MSKVLIALFFCAALPFDLGSAHAQVSALPPEIQQKLAAAGPKWRGSLEDTQPMYALFQPLLKVAPKDGVKITKDLAYGSDPKQVLDVYKPSGKAAVPVLIFIHGGAYVRGSKDDGKMYGNITTWFARQGVLGINANYPLAAAVKWPSGAQDVGRIVAWAKINATTYGGEPNQIFLIGHSAGATHVASYIFDKSLQPTSGPGVAGAVLISGRYRVSYDPNDPNAKNTQAYFGEDTSAYAVRSPITISENPRCLFSSSMPSTRISDWMCWEQNCMKRCANAMAGVHAIQGWRSTITSPRSLPSTPQTNNSDAKFWNLLDGDVE
jgi:acetyl esterase/lipase